MSQAHGFRRAERIAALEISEIVQLTERAAALRAEGRDVIALSTGEPDFPTPGHVIEAAHAAALAGKTRYPATMGTPELRDAIAARRGVVRENVIVSTGAKQVLANAMLASLDPGDEVIMPAPYWTSYSDIVTLAGGWPVVLPCPMAQSFKLTPGMLEAAITPATRWLMLNSPSNPSGAIYSATELVALAKVLRQHPHVLVMVDEIYEHLSFVPFTSFTDVAPDLAPRCLLVNGVSKAYAMTGWRIGWGVGPADIVKAMGAVQGQITSGASSVSQAAALAALTGDQALLNTRREVLRARRDKVVAALNALPGIACPAPDGAFYAFPDIGAAIAAGGFASDAEFCAALLDGAGVAIVPGRAFGLPGHARLSFAYSDADLDAGLARIASFVATFTRSALLPDAQHDLPKETHMTHSDTLAAAGLTKAELTGGTLAVTSPIDGTEMARVAETRAEEMQVVIARSRAAFKAWRTLPAPRRGELVRLLGEELRAAKEELGAVVTLEAGKITSEGLGEVQEMIDICDFAVGLSRQLYGLTIASERPGHRMSELWHPMGPVGVISAFNFPVAVWSWNAALALVCGNPVIWKPSEKTPLTALATMKIMDRAIARFGNDAPEGLAQLVIGGADVGAALVESRAVPILSATGSTRMGSIVGPKVAARWGRAILELGGNNAMIVAPSADLDMAVRGIVFSAVGTAGQRCTTLRRLIVHNSIREDLVAKLKAAYASLPIGDPRAASTLIGPLVDTVARDAMLAQLDKARADGGTVHGGAVVSERVPGGAYVTPALVEMPGQTDTVREETFAPILYVMGYDDLDEAIALQNDVPQGLSSCIFTLNMREADTFLSASGSDCGIANVNIGPSGAEIGGAFGGEKETGGGRESGSDAWKGYMRRQTSTVNYSADLPLAQGVKFEF